MINDKLCILFTQYSSILKILICYCSLNLSERWCNLAHLLVIEQSFLVVFSFFEKTTYCCRARRLSVLPSVEIISFRGNSLPNRPIELKIGLNVREGVVHVRKA